jgi:hypothetical protein
VTGHLVTRCPRGGRSAGTGGIDTTFSGVVPENPRGVTTRIAGQGMEPASTRRPGSKPLVLIVIEYNNHVG